MWQRPSWWEPCAPGGLGGGGDGCLGGSWNSRVLALSPVWAAAWPLRGWLGLLFKDLSGALKSRAQPLSGWGFLPRGRTRVNKVTGTTEVSLPLTHPFQGFPRDCSLTPPLLGGFGLQPARRMCRCLRPGVGAAPFPRLLPLIIYSIALPSSSPRVGWGRAG